MWKSRPLHTNCLFWSVRQWYRRGGYLCIRRGLVETNSGQIPGYYWHFAWLPRHQKYLYHFQPINGAVTFPWVWFKGFVQRGERR